MQHKYVLKKEKELSGLTTNTKMKGTSHSRRIVNFMESHLDEYDYYSCDHRATSLGHSRKGRSKKEASLNTNKPNPAGHERKVAIKLQNSEKKRKENSKLRAN